MVRHCGGTVHRLGHLVQPGSGGILDQLIRGLAHLQPADPGVDAQCNLTPLEPASRQLAEAILTDALACSHIVAPTCCTMSELIQATRERNVAASPLEQALTRRMLLSPGMRHPSNLFLSTGWQWGGSLPAVPRMSSWERW